MNTRLVRIGNSRGVRIPKPLIEEAGLDEEVQLRVVDGGIMIEPAPRARTSWGGDARLVRERGDDGLLDEPAPTAFDDSEWEWE